MKRILAVLATTALMVALSAMPTLAQPVFTGGINILVTDVASGNQVSVQVPIGVAANVCGIQANVLAEGNVAEPVNCTASTTQDLPVRFRP